MMHEIKIVPNANGFVTARCRCGWVHGPDTEYQANQEADEHLIAVGRSEEAERR